MVVLGREIDTSTTEDVIKLFVNAKDLSNVSKICLKCVLTNLNHLIGFKSDINYKIEEVYYNKDGMFRLEFPIESHISEENFSKSELIGNRIGTLKRFLKNFKSEALEDYSKWALYTLHKDKFDFKSFVIECGNDIKEHAELNYDLDWKEEVYEIDDDTRQIHYINLVCPFIKNYGIYAGYNKQFKEFNYSYNCLHMYEHLMTYAWQSSTKCYMLNGSTYIQALCFIYSIHKDEKAFNKYLIDYLKFHEQTRSSKGWKQLAKGVQLETKRTISETNQDRSLTNFARTEPDVWKDNIYDTEIFKHYSRQKFTLLLITPSKVELDYKKYLKPLKSEKENLKYKTFNYMPLTVIRDKQDRKFDILKKSNKESYEDCKNSAFGVDCYAKPVDKTLDLNCLNSTLANGLLMLKGDKLKEYVNNILLPFTNEGICSIDFYQKDIAPYLIK